MDWIRDHLQIIVIVAAGIASLLSRRKKAQDERELEESLPPQVPVEGDENLRRVREEIARKRAEREGRETAEGSMPRPFSPPVDQDREPAPGLDEWAEPAPAPVPEHRVAREAEAAEAVLARQRELQERLEALRREREATLALARSKAEASPYGQSASASVATTHRAGTLLKDLRSPAAARRAIIELEVFGRPKSL